MTVLHLEHRYTHCQEQIEVTARKQGDVTINLENGTYAMLRPLAQLKGEHKRRAQEERTKMQDETFVVHRCK